MSARRLSLSRSFRPAKTLCTWILYPQIFLRSTSFPLESPKAGQAAPTSDLLTRSQRYTPAPGLIQRGGQISKKPKSYGVGKAWATLCLSGIFASLILQATVTECQGWRVLSQFCITLRRNSESLLQTLLEAKAIL